MRLTLPFPRPPSEDPDAAHRAPWMSRRQRLAGLIAALLLEALVVILLLTLGTRRTVEMAGDERPLSTFDIASPTPEPAEPEAKTEARPSEQSPESVPPSPSQPAPPVRVPEAPVAPPAAPVQLPSTQPIAAAPAAPPAVGRPREVYGPPAPRGSSSGGGSDTPLVEGSGPNGEKLYAAAWQREPYDSELRGYLSTAQPGWALIACRTVADFRVEDCVALGENPRGSQLARAVLAAAWQFRVRPPRIGGRVQVGEWVRIRIEYGIRQRLSWEKE